MSKPDDGTFITRGQALPDFHAQLAAWVAACLERRANPQADNTLTESLSSFPSDFSVGRGEELADSAQEGNEGAYERIAVAYLASEYEGAADQALKDTPGSGSPARNELVRELGEWPVDGSLAPGGWFTWPKLMRMCGMQGLLTLAEINEIKVRREAGK